MKKLATIGLALVAMLAMTAVAVAQVAEPVITLTGSGTPTKGGTKKKPKNATLVTDFKVNKESRKTVANITYFVPKNIVLSGKGFKYCTAETINLKGEGACPKGSLVGKGTSTAVLGPNFAPLGFTVNVYAGGKNEIALALAQTNGGSVRTNFKGTITKASGPYGQKISVDIPASVQSPAAGLYSYITEVKTTIKGKFVKGSGKKKTTSYFASLTGCPKDKQHHLGVQLGYAQNDTGPAGKSPVVTATSPCKP